MKRYNNFILLILLFVFFLLFIFNLDIKMSVIDSVNLWLNTLVPSMVPMYLITDLLLNYGLSYHLFSLFKTNKCILIILSLLLGSPANAKYICDFYKDEYIDLNNANYLLTFAYSPNPLFILGIAPSLSIAIKTLIFIYITNIINAIIFRKLNKKEYICEKRFKVRSFSEVLESSIYKSFKILVLILGIVIVYGIINTFVNMIMPDNAFIKAILEMTNALSYMLYSDNTKWFTFACVFGGLSIHTQIKSILEDTPVNYKYFLYGRVIASSICIIFTIL